MRNIWITAALAISMALAQTANAGTLEVTGQNVGIDDPAETFELVNGQTYLLLKYWQVHLGYSEGNPLHNAISTCSASCTMDADGSTGMCFGGCTGYDVDGDIYHLVWDGFADGTWTMVGGTGKWQGASGGGNWYPNTLASTVFTNPKWDGSITLQ
jgi:hypothetical protein